MNLVELVCNELGVKVGEKWKGNDGYYHIIETDGKVRTKNKSGNLLYYGYMDWEDIFTNKLKPVKEG